jgi:hypothetical protein
LPLDQDEFEEDPLEELFGVPHVELREVFPLDQDEF